MAGGSAIRHRQSAGGVIYRRQGDEVEICLIATGRNTRWQLPKGQVEQGETRREAALREVREETGLEGVIEALLGEIAFRYRIDPTRRVHKRVVFFLIACTAGSTDRHDGEVDEARFFPIDEALGRLTHRSERDIVERARALLLPLAQAAPRG